ncbi:MAG: hypothetical protein HY961_03585 [Ignavibacteriae bacterium]|nr:hypothetical protein [Ignavibacteriota bacterium]
MRSTPAITHSLLTLDREKTAALLPNAKVYGFALAVLNLIPCGLSEGFLRRDASGYTLAFFLFCHSAVYFLLSLTYFTGSGRDILQKIQIFPTNSMSRFLFTLASNLRHPFTIGLFASNVFFAFIVFREKLGTAALLASSYLLLMISIAAVGTLLFLILERKRLPVQAALAVAAIFILTTLVASVVFHIGTTTMAFGPVIDLIVRGVLLSARGEWSVSLLSTALLLVISILMFIAGRKLT